MGREGETGEVYVRLLQEFGFILAADRNVLGIDRQVIATEGKRNFLVTHDGRSGALAFLQW